MAMMAGDLTLLEMLEFILDDDDMNEDDSDDDFPVMTLVVSLRGIGGRVETEKDARSPICRRKGKCHGEAEFRGHFRLSTSTYQYMCNILSLDLLPKAPGGFEVVPPEKQLLLFIHYIANEGTSIRTMALLFGIAESTVQKIVYNVSKAICRQRQRFIRWPNAARRREISAAFEEISRFAGIVGAIDGTHIMVANIRGGTADYYNRKKYPSVQLQLVVDDLLLIINSYVGWPGRRNYMKTCTCMGPSSI
jgi:hypothetical protein